MRFDSLQIVGIRVEPKRMTVLKREMIPWLLFRQALYKRYEREEWLTFWCFSDDGVSILQDESEIQDVIQLLFHDHETETRH
jgi:hypothetical protein